ncbi:VOC family protein [Mycobacterium deserti]|uniref:VOC family protein n=1 Tax=Mycobacterium deserti TaxID=2978347 RepID=A0ABT2M5B4_9MYCO|nr:VOC family protein [Mycobacterium deserti]MCT7657456.1 VOC family protein [Mycobacterium deserti]
MTSIGDEFAGPTPQIAAADAAAAIAFYREAFGADELVRNHAPDGRIMHSELLICDGRLLVVDEFGGDDLRAPTGANATTVRLHLYVADVDAVFERALAAGANPVRAPAVEFWGDRYAVIRDPMGHLWSLATQVDELSPGGHNLRARAWVMTQPPTPD